jgi:hypothetical protein
MERIQELDLVALVGDLDRDGLHAGQTGTVVFVHDAGKAFEVEFPMSPRKSIVATVPRESLLKLRGLSTSPSASQI